MNFFRSSSVFVGLALASIVAAQAAPSSPTLDAIKQAGVMTVGVRDSSFPFSYLDNNNHYLGFSVEITEAVVAQVKKELNMPNLQTKMLPVTSQNRIALVQNGQMQLECGSTTHNKERAGQVDFSTTFFIIGTRLLVPKNSTIGDFSDLGGKTVVTIAGSTSERILRNLNETKSMKMNIVSSTDASTAFYSLETGRAAAYMMDDAVLAGNRSTAKDPNAWKIVATPQSREAYACMMPKGDATFKALVDKVISTRETDGTETQSYKKWFLSPIPPKNLNINLEMTDDVKNLFAHPNDEAFQ